MPDNNPNDGLQLVRAAATDGVNFGLEHEDIIARLREWQQRCSFEIVRAKHDTVRIRFLTLPANVAAFAREIYDFCPDVIDQGYGAYDALIESVESRGDKLPAEVQSLVEGIDFSKEDFGVELLSRSLQRRDEINLWWD